MLQVEFIKQYGKMRELMEEPAYVLSGAAVASTVSETATFLWDSTNADSNVILTRDTEYDVGGDVVTHSAYSVSNAPTVTNVVTDQTVNTEVSLKADTVLTITGTNFGQNDNDLEVFVYVQPIDGARGPINTSSKEGRFPVRAVITAVNGGDTEITATVSLPQSGSKTPQKGVCEVEVRNKVRFLKSARWSGLTVA